MCTQVQRSTPGWPAGFAHVKHPPVRARLHCALLASPVVAEVYMLAYRAR